MNRSTIREARRAARRNGCTCRPEIHPIPLHLGPPGATAGAWVQHLDGCALGGQVAELNRQGIFPALVTVPTERCDR